MLFLFSFIGMMNMLIVSENINEFINKKMIFFIVLFID